MPKDKKKINKKESEIPEVVLKDINDYVLPKDAHPLIQAQLQKVEETLEKFEKKGLKLEQQINFLKQEIQDNNNNLMINFAIQKQLHMQLGIDKLQKIINKK